MKKSVSPFKWLTRYPGSFVCLFLPLFPGCGRNTDFLYPLKDQPAQLVDTVHKLKELQGETQVDILWVIDNSDSMFDHQNQVIKNADTFINSFVAKGGLEWKMGVLSTSIAEQPYVGFSSTTQLTFRTPRATEIFKDSVRKLGTHGDPYEQTFGPIQKQLDAHPDFLRKRATLAIIMITDAPEQSRIPAADILKYLIGLKGDIRRIVAYGGFACPDFGCKTMEWPWTYAGSAYETVIKATKGKAYPLCKDFGTNLADLGKDLVTRIHRPYIALKDRPVISTLHVGYQGKDLPGGPMDKGGFWVYDFELNRVTFHSLDFAPGDNEEVSVSYQVADEVVR